MPVANKEEIADAADMEVRQYIVGEGGDKLQVGEVDADAAPEFELTEE